MNARRRLSSSPICAPAFHPGQGTSGPVEPRVFFPLSGLRNLRYNFPLRHCGALGKLAPGVGVARETVESLCQKAQQAVAQGQNEQARQTYLQALALRADVPDVHYGLATVYFLSNDLAKSAYHFKEVTR